MPITSFNLSSGNDAALRCLADRSHLTMSWLVNRALEAWFAGQGSGQVASGQQVFLVVMGRGSDA